MKDSWSPKIPLSRFESAGFTVMEPDNLRIVGISVMTEPTTSRVECQIELAPARRLGPLENRVRRWLGNICFKLKRDLKWDPDAEQFIGDEEANRLVDRPRRGPWQI